MATLKELAGAQMVGRDGEAIGPVERVLSSEATGRPAWVTVRMGVMRKEHVIPLEGSQSDAHSIHIPYTQDMVKNSPKLDFGDRLTADDVNTLAQYYGTSAQTSTDPLPGNASRPASASTPSSNATSSSPSAQAAQGAAPGGAHGRAATHADRVPEDLHRDATLEAVRYGERIQVAKESREAGRVKLRTYVEQAQTEQKVELHRETFEVERVPITDTARFKGEHPDWAEQDQEIVLFAEQAHVSKEVVPLERIVVRKKMVSEEQVVRDTIRTQQFEVVEPVTASGGGRNLSAGDARRH
jgi:stress response protein YsnF